MTIKAADFEGINCGETVSFGDNLSKEDIMRLFKELVDIEVARHENFVYEFKNLDIGVVADIIRYSLGRVDYANPTILTNVMVLVRNYNTLDDSFFKSSAVFVSTLEGLLDLKLALKADIRRFNREISILFVSCLKYASKFEFNFTEDKPIDIPPLYSAVLLSMDIFTLSSMLANCDPFSSADLRPVANSISFVAEFSSKATMLDSLFKRVVTGG